MSNWTESLPLVQLGRLPGPPGPVGNVNEAANLDHQPIYTMDPRLRGIQCELLATPREGAVGVMHFIMGFHAFGGLTQRGQVVFPHVASHQEGDPNTPEGTSLHPNNMRQVDGRPAATRRVCLLADFPKMPAQIACVLLTISSNNYRRFGSIVLHLYPHSKDRSGVVTRGGDIIARRDLTFLATSDRSCGTLVIAALVRRGGWWSLLSPSPWFSAARTPMEFKQQMCMPVRVRSRAKGSKPWADLADRMRSEPPALAWDPACKAGGHLGQM